VLYDLIDRPRRQQPPALALMPRLSARPAARRILAALRGARRIGARRLGGVARGPLALALELRDPLILLGHPLLKTPDLLVHPQQHRDDRLTPLPIDRLGLFTLHTTTIRRPAVMSP